MPSTLDMYEYNTTMSLNVCFLSSVISLYITCIYEEKNKFIKTSNFNLAIGKDIGTMINTFNWTGLLKTMVVFNQQLKPLSRG